MHARKLLLYRHYRLEHFNKLFHLGYAREVELHDLVLDRRPTCKLGRVEEWPTSQQETAVFFQCSRDRGWSYALQFRLPLNQQQIDGLSRVSAQSNYRWLQDLGQPHALLPFRRNFSETKKRYLPD